MRTRRSWMFVACALLLGSTFAVLAQGCGTSEQVEVLCPRRDGTGTYDPWCDVCATDLSIKGCDRCLVDPALGPSFACYLKDGGSDAQTDSATACTGDCLPLPPPGWDGPELLWIGPAGTAPACPDDAPVVAYEGHADLVAPPPASCAACACSPSSGTCALPSHFTTSSATCAAGNGMTRVFDAPAGWDGTCTAYNSIAMGDLCNGVLCSVSVIAPPLSLTENGCTPSGGTISAEPAAWSSDVRSCAGAYPVGGCGDLASTCGPGDAHAAGFRRCILREGDKDCPPSYPEKHISYTGFDDTRACAPCTCGMPDSGCKGTLQVFADAACTSKPVTVDMTTAGEACGDLAQPGQALGSKEAVAAYLPGTCAAGGGEVVGGVEPVGATTFCCLVSV